jgi:hypothetical protein
MSSARITLDNPAFAGRLRDFGRGTPFMHQPNVRTQPQSISDVFVEPRSYSRPEKQSFPPCHVNIAQRYYKEILHIHL